MQCLDVKKDMILKEFKLFFNEALSVANPKTHFLFSLCLSLIKFAISCATKLDASKDDL